MTSLSGFQDARAATSCTGEAEVRLDGAPVVDEQGKVLRPAGPLYGMKVRDQDGVGICYAEALVTQLKTALPGNPDFSSITTAIEGHHHSNTTQAMVEAKGNKKVYFEGSWMCDAFYRLKGGRVKNAGHATGRAAERPIGLCKTSDVLLEKVIDQGASSDVQEKLFGSLGRYFDGAKDDSDLRDLNALLPGILKQARLEAETECRLPGPRRVDAMIGRMRDRAQRVVDESAYTLPLVEKIEAARRPADAVIQRKFEKMRELSRKEDLLKGRGLKGRLAGKNKRDEAAEDIDRLKLEIEELGKQYQGLLDAAKPEEEKIRRELSQYDSGGHWIDAKTVARLKRDLGKFPASPPYLDPKTRATFDRKFNEAAKNDPEGKRISSWLPDLLKEAEVPQSWLSVDSDVLYREEALGRIFEVDLARGVSPERCRRVATRYFLNDQEQVVRAAQKIDTVCRPPEKLKKFAAHVGELYDEELLTSPLGEAALLLQKIEEASQKQHRTPRELFMSVAAPGCTEKNRVYLPENLECNSTYLANGLAGEHGAVQVNQAAFEKKVTGTIEAGRGVMFSVCAKGFEDARIKVDSKVCDEGGRHALVMTGYRCRNGVRELLFQNSYGKNSNGCPTCTDAGNGRFWIPAERAFEMTIAVSTTDTVAPVRKPAAVQKKSGGKRAPKK